MPLATTPAASVAPLTPPLSSADAVAASTPLSTAAMETVKRRSLQLSSDLQEFVAALARKDSPSVSIPVELKLLAALVVLFLFLVFLVAVLWDRYGKEIGELYTPNPASGAAGGDAHGEETQATVSILYLYTHSVAMVLY
jgi:hypothetical protein